MQLSPATTAFSAATTASADKATSAVGADFETFLKMMTTQMQNQDPMNPMDSSDYAVQLATFSGVEQQTKTNKLLEGLQTQFGMLGMAQMAGWVGNEARAAMPVWVDGDSVDLSPNPPAEANRAVIVVSNAAGDVVNRFDIAPLAKDITWDPVDISGQPLPTGTYNFQLESYRDDEQLSTVGVEVYAPITEVRGGSAGMTLVLSGGIEVPVSSVTGLRG